LSRPTAIRVDDIVDYKPTKNRIICHVISAVNSIREVTTRTKNRLHVANLTTAILGRQNGNEIVQLCES
jgi:hypothetical protein